jgi:hypothetical protein
MHLYSSWKTAACRRPTREILNLSFVYYQFTLIVGVGEGIGVGFGGSSGSAVGAGVGVGDGVAVGLGRLGGGVGVAASGPLALTLACEIFARTTPDIANSIANNNGRAFFIIFTSVFREYSGVFDAMAVPAYRYWRFILFWVFEESSQFKLSC